MHTRVFTYVHLYISHSKTSGPHVGLRGPQVDVADGCLNVCSCVHVALENQALVRNELKSDIGGVAAWRHV